MFRLLQIYIFNDEESPSLDMYNIQNVSPVKGNLFYSSKQQLVTQKWVWGNDTPFMGLPFSKHSVNSVNNN